MISRCYSVYDRKTITYNPPFYAPTDGAAIRIISDASNDGSTSLGRHPNDYVLYCVGEFDDQKGLMQPCSPLVHVIDVSALVQHQGQLALSDHEARFAAPGKELQ